MPVSVVVPYAGDCPYRKTAWEWVEAKYESLGWQVVTGEANPAHWVKADAVNDGLAKADGDLVVIADADCWDPAVARAVELVEQGRPYVIPHQQVWRLDLAATGLLIAGYEPERPKTHRNHVDQNHGKHTGVPGGGVTVLPRAHYDECPLDRRFVGWGGEDHAWGYALEALYGPPLRLSWPCWHLWHPPQPRPQPTGVSGSYASEWLRLEYKAARRDPARTRELIGEGMQGNAVITIMRPGPIDEYGDPSGSSFPVATISNAAVAPKQSPDITTRGRAGVVFGLTVYLDPGVDIRHSDQVVIDDVTWEVDGEPQYWADPFSGQAKGIQLDLIRSQG